MLVCLLYGPAIYSLLQFLLFHRIYMYSTSLLASNPGKQVRVLCCTHLTLLWCATIVSPAVRAFSGHRNSTFYVKAAISPEGRYVKIYMCIHNYVAPFRQ